MHTSAENTLPKFLDLHCRVGNLSLENSLNLAGCAASRGVRDEVPYLSRQREICFITHHQYMCNLRRDKLFRDPFAAHQANAFCGNGVQASAIVEATGYRFPKNGIHIEKIVSKQLFDGVRFGGKGHVGVIFDAPEIEDQTFGAKPAFHPAKSVCGLVDVSQHVSYFVGRMCARNDQIQVRWLRYIFRNAV